MSTPNLCLGEALIDVVFGDGAEPHEHVGGSLFNVACGLAALGEPTSMLSWWGNDGRGKRIADAAARAGLEVLPGTSGATKTPVAYARLDENGKATYEFDLTWQVPRGTDLSPFGHLHTGSFAATLAPGGDDVLALIDQIRTHATVSYDPNIRPTLMGTPDDVRSRIEHVVAHADLVKASDEDLEWLYPRDTADAVARRWLKQGPALVVVTRGSAGADGYRDDGVVHVDSAAVDVVDTVGAGDSFMAGLLSGLLSTGLLGSRAAADQLRQMNSDVSRALRRGVATSGITVTHAGAYAPTLAELA